MLMYIFRPCFRAGPDETKTRARSATIHESTGTGTGTGSIGARTFVSAAWNYSCRVCSRITSKADADSWTA